MSMSPSLAAALGQLQAPDDLISLESAEDVARYGAAPVSQAWFEAQERERVTPDWGSYVAIGLLFGVVGWGFWREQRRMGGRR